MCGCARTGAQAGRPKNPPDCHRKPRSACTTSDTPPRRSGSPRTSDWTSASVRPAGPFASLSNVLRAARTASALSHGACGPPAQGPAGLAKCIRRLADFARRDRDPLVLACRGSGCKQPPADLTPEIKASLEGFEVFCRSLDRDPSRGKPQRDPARPAVPRPVPRNVCNARLLTPRSRKPRSHGASGLSGRQDLNLRPPGPQPYPGRIANSLIPAKASFLVRLSEVLQVRT
jgi:hypothetical protein